MKLTISIPAHAAFYNRHGDDYSQDEVDAAIKKHEEQKEMFRDNAATFGAIARENVFVHQGDGGIKFDDEALALFGSSVSQLTPTEVIASATANRQLQTYIENVENILEANRGNFQL